MEVSTRTHSEAAARNGKRKMLKMKINLKCLMEQNLGILFVLKALNPLPFGCPSIRQSNIMDFNEKKDRPIMDVYAPIDMTSQPWTLSRKARWV